MSQQVPKDDERLVAFLRHHRPEAPPASPDVEERILAAVATQPLKSRRQLWFLAPALAAGLLLAVGGYTWGQKFADRPPANPPTDAELARLEEFLESSWDGLLYPEETLPATFPSP